MNNGRVRKSPNTLIRAYKKKNRERNIILQCIVVSVVVVSLVIISLIHGKFQADKLKNQYQDGKTISTFIEEGTDTIKRQLQDLSYVNSVGEEKESGRLMNGRYSYSKCVVLDETAYEDMVKPIKISCRFICKYNCWFRNQGSCNRNTLLLSAR